MAEGGGGREGSGMCDWTAVGSRTRDANGREDLCRCRIVTQAPRCKVQRLVCSRYAISDVGVEELCLH